MTDTIPFLPKSIAIGLQKDIIQYMIELKFLLLFFEKPTAILSTHTFDFINDEIINDVRNRKKNIVTNELVDDGSSKLYNLNALESDEWDEIMSHCDVFNFNIRVTDEPMDNEEKLPEDLIDFIKKPLNEKKYSKQYLKKKAYDKEILSFTQDIFLIQMQRLNKVLTLCHEKMIPMVWGEIEDTYICNIYLTYLLKKNSDKIISRTSQADFRRLLGDQLLKEVFNFDILNISTVPVIKIIEFRKNNWDLLENFLFCYRDFLVELQMEPLSATKIIDKYSKELVNDMNIIKKEVLNLRNSSKFNWLKIISQDAFDSANKGLKVSDWSILANPLAIGLKLGGKLIEIGGKAVGYKFNKQEKFNSFLINSKSGYLWKAAESFK